MKRNLLALIFQIAAVLALPLAGAERPNFILIFTDDQGYQDLGCYGSPDIATPHLDRMAEEGMRFTSFYAQTICGPSRTALMTGSYPLRVAQVRNRYETHPVVHAEEITIAEVLRERGYRSGAFGKWDLAKHSQSDWIPELLPRGQGFDYFFGTPSSNDRVVHLIRNEGVVEGNADMATLTKRYTDEAIAFIEENRDEPFFVYVAHTMPHTLLEASEEFRGRSKAGLYGDVIEEIDHHSGRILDKVKELGVDDRTYLIFTSDNGPWLLREDHGGHALPLRSGKTTCWEGGVRVPCIVRAPGRVPAGTTCDLVTSTMDFLPTFASLAGAGIPDDRTIDGIDISRIWSGEQKELDRPFFYYQHHYLRGVRKGDWKVMLKHEEGPKSETARWAHHVDPEDSRPLAAHQLFNLRDDIGETTDLAAKFPDKLHELLELAEKARTDIGDFDRIGENARFFDEGPNRLEQREEAPAPKGKGKGTAKKAPAKQGPGAMPKTGKPNIVLINADDLGYGDLGCYGATLLQTPNIDRLAGEGRRFTDAHSASAVCSPSRYGLMTGRFPLRKNFWGPTPFTQELTIDTDRPTLASVLRSAGYATAVIGKWHLGFGKGKTDWNGALKPGPLEVGFDYYFGMPTVNSGPPFVYVENHGVVDYDPADPFVMRQKSVTQEWPEKGGYGAIGGARKAHERYRDEFVGTTFAEKAVTWIKEQDKNRPFFLYLATTNIHHPFTPHPRFRGTSECGLYGDFVHELDWIVGEVLNTLDELDLAENTLVVFTSDNGGMLNHTGQKAWEMGHRLNGDLLGCKFGAWEGGHRVPFLVRWPGRVPAGTKSDALVSQIDLLATFAAAAGVALPERSETDSVDQLAEFTGTASGEARDTLIISPNSPKHLTVRQGKWVYIPAQDEGGFQGKKKGDHLFAGAAAQTLTNWVNSDIIDGKIREGAPPAQLYDLEADPRQTKNVYVEHPEVVAELSTRLHEWRRKIPDSEPLGWINLKQKPGKASAAPGKVAPRMAAFRSRKRVHLDFESGQLEPWRVVEGEFGHLIGSRDEFFGRAGGEYNKQGQFYLTTLEPSADAEKGKDAQTGTVVSPLFIPEGDTMTFRVGGGGGEGTYVALCTADGNEVETVRGANQQVMHEARFDLRPYVGKTMFLKIVDRSTGGWGHITVDNFQFDAEWLDEQGGKVHE